MLYKIGEFKVKKEHIDEAKKLIREFAVKVQAESRTLTYDIYLESDGRTFFSFMIFDDSDAEEYHQNTDYAKIFTSKLYPMCEVEPAFTTLTKF